jgi:hypothetical protein
MVLFLSVTPGLMKAGSLNIGWQIRNWQLELDTALLPLHLIQALGEYSISCTDTV